MTDRKQALQDLLAKVEAGRVEWASIKLAFRPSRNNCISFEGAFFGSLDAALLLHNAVLPGWWFSIDWVSASVTPSSHDAGVWFQGVNDGNPSRAWLVAIIKALIFEAEQSDLQTDPAPD